MALDGDRLGTNIANAIKASIPAPGVKITDAQLEIMWQTVAGEIVTEFVTNGVVNTTGVTGIGTPGGPLPITAQPGAIS